MAYINKREFINLIKKYGEFERGNSEFNGVEQALQDQFTITDNIKRYNLDKNELEYIYELANNGNGYANFYLGIIYSHHINVDKNIPLAYYYFFKAYEQECSDSYSSIAIIEDINIPNKVEVFSKSIIDRFLTIEDSAELKRKAIKAKNSNAYLAKYKETGNIKYLIKSVELNNSEAMINLAYYYECIEDYESAYKYYKIAMNKNKPQAFYSCSKLYMYGLIGEGKNEEKACELLQRACDMNHKEAYADYGAYIFYYNKNIEKGLRYMIRSAKLGHANMCYKLARLYEYDEGKMLEMLERGKNLGNYGCVIKLKTGNWMIEI